MTRRIFYWDIPYFPKSFLQLKYNHRKNVPASVNQETIDSLHKYISNWYKEGPHFTICQNSPKWALQWDLTLLYISLLTLTKQDVSDDLYTGRTKFS